MILYIISDIYQIDYWFLLLASIALIFASLLFVHACFTTANSTSAYKPKLQPIIMACCGSKEWAKKHCASDWLITTWFCYFASLFFIVGSIAIVVMKVRAGNDRQVYIFASGIFDVLFFLVGCMYLLAGSYHPVNNKISRRLSQDFS